MSHLTDDLLSAYIDGGLTQTQRRLAAAHLARCVECRIAAGQIGRAMRRMGIKNGIGAKKLFIHQTTSIIVFTARRMRRR